MLYVYVYIYILLGSERVTRSEIAGARGLVLIEITTHHSTRLSILRQNKTRDGVRHVPWEEHGVARLVPAAATDCRYQLDVGHKSLSLKANTWWQKLSTKKQPPPPPKKKNNNYENEKITASLLMIFWIFMYSVTAINIEISKLANYYINNQIAKLQIIKKSNQQAMN